MRPAASRAGAPPLSALIPIEKNGSPQGMTLVPTTVGRGLLRHGQVLRFRLGGRDRGAVRRLLGGIRRLGRGGSGGRRRGRRLGGEHRGGEQADGQQGRSNSLHRQGTSWAASTRYTARGLRSRLGPGPSLDEEAALGEECARPKGAP